MAKKNITSEDIKENAKIDIESLTLKEIEEELKREDYKSKYIKVLKSTIYALVIIAALAALLATFFIPVFQISGSSMSPTYNNGDFVISVKDKNLKRGDIIAFYYGNKILVKRVIATQGEWVTMDKEGSIYINGDKLEEEYIKDKTLGDCEIKFPYQVPVDSWFVLSDNRIDSLDSRNIEIGTVSNDDVIGKIIFRILKANKS